jgi:hypothetical protein
MTPTWREACRQKAFPELPLMVVWAFPFANQTKQAPQSSKLESYPIFSLGKYRVCQENRKPAERLSSALRAVQVEGNAVYQELEKGKQQKAELDCIYLPM